jgi:hypothetical protein
MKAELMALTLLTASFRCEERKPPQGAGLKQVA